MKRWIGVVTALMALMGTAHATQPEKWEIRFQPAGTDIMAAVTAFGDYTFWIVGAIMVFVMALLAIVIVRFNSRTHPTPSKVSHNTLLEVVWTVAPVLILVAIAIPSFRLLYFETTVPNADLTVKATGNQWYWNYAYPNPGMEKIDYTSYLLQDDARQKLEAQYHLTDHEVPRLLAVDYPMVVPVGAVVRMQTTSNDVNHSWTVPSFGVKMDAIPGRLNEFWFRAEHTGTYWGECSELCGREHAFMPIQVEVVTPEAFKQWIALANTDIEKASNQILIWKSQALGNQVASLTSDAAGKQVASVTGKAY